MDVTTFFSAINAEAAMCHVMISFAYLLVLTANYLLIFDPDERPQGEPGWDLQHTGSPTQSTSAF
jgi:hypothetical protein